MVCLLSTILGLQPVWLSARNYLCSNIHSKMENCNVFPSLLVLTCVCCVHGARILAVLPLACRSHHNFHQGVLQALADRGHEVVVYGPFPLTQPVPNYKNIYVNTSYNDDFFSYKILYEIISVSKTVRTQNMLSNLRPFTEDALRHESIKKLAKSKERFDLVFVEAFLGQEVFLAFGRIFNAPTIVLQPFGTFSLVNKVMGNSLALSFIPDFNLPFSDNMSLYERLLNSYATLRVLFTYYTEILPSQQSLVDLYLDLEDAPPLSEMMSNISLVFTNAHQTFNYPQPLTPNIIPLGGIHPSSDIHQLPQNIQSFMDEAKHGVIYFSLGTIVPEHKMSAQFYQQFISVFKNLKQRVLWKIRKENFTKVPDNVMIAKWFPQQDVLAHPKTVLFITHGGLSSLQEVTLAGVPVVGVPFFSDQLLNVRFCEARGVGVKIDFFSLNEENILTAINKVLSDPKYKENAVKQSKIFRSVPMSQQELAVFWTEYVLQTGGAHHLRPASANMTWYQLMLLDVLAAILAAILVTMLAGAAVVYFMCKIIVRRFTVGNNNTPHDKKLK